MPGASFGKLRYLCVYSLVKNQLLTSNLYHCRSDITTTSESGEISYGVAGNIHDINKHLHVFPPFSQTGTAILTFYLFQWKYSFKIGVHMRKKKGGK